MVTKFSPLLRRPETAMMQEKLLVSVAGYLELYFFRFC